jgi:hypothetical protein
MNSSSKRQKKWRPQRVIVWCIVVFVILVLGAYLGPQTITYCRLRPSLLRSPDSSPRGWGSAPRPLANTTASISEGTTVSYYGYKIDAPWKGIDKESNEGRAVEIIFKTGQKIVFVNPQYSDRDPISSDYHVASDDLRLVLEPGRREPKYEQFKAVISTTPSQLSPLRFRREFVRTRVLLEIKGLWFEHNTAVPDIFSFETKDYRGFEISDLSSDRQIVELNLFDREDHWFTVNISCDARSGVKLTQPEINRVIQSFGAASPSPPK